MAKIHEPLRGIVVPLVTPLHGRDELDRTGLERLIEHVIGGGVSGVFILGTSGEAPSLSHRLQRELVEQTCALVGERVPVLVGITDTSMVEALELAACAAQAGARAVVSSAPYYLPIGQPELVECIQLLVSELSLPLVLYNLPRVTGVSFEPETVRQLSALEKIAGIKDSSGDLSYFQKLLEIRRLRPDWSFLVGPEHLLFESTLMGGDGGVNGGANFHPRLFVDLFQALTTGQRARAEKLHQQVQALGKIYQIGKHASGFLKGMKCACSLLNLCDDRMADPFRKFNLPEREQVRTILESLQIRSLADVSEMVQPVVKP